ncbi:cysteine desulfurase [Candidatus Pacearchaeota archaeon]|nr:cysteine desulfurase [Candidatus Pacearchaeota archaeon]MBI2057167.1 cysteine desulfurase [Candidatus Pacearchaeota archaeon]
MKSIYLDNASSTKIDKKVLKAMIPYFSERYANPSSKHEAGQQIREAVESSRKMIASSINAKPNEIIFTSGGTESNNFALKGLFFANYPEKNHIITTKIEHDSILETCKWLEKQGAKITYLDVDKEGFIDLAQLKSSITKKTFLVSIIHGNNEIGTIQDLEKIGKICKEKNILFHTDACQSFTKTFLDIKKHDINLVTLNSHKIHGPKGIGALYLKEELKKKIIPLIHGGGHEFQMRSGTENVPGIMGFAEAVKISNKKEIEKMKKLRDKLISEILKIPNTKLNGSAGEKRLCNNINISFKDIDAEMLQSYLEKKGIYISAGSACQSHTDKSSHVLKALGLSENAINGSIRISLSKYTTEKEVEYFLEEIKKIAGKLKEINK